MNDEEYVQKLRVASSTYLSYFMNAELNYVEQDLGRIEDTYNVFDEHIISITGLSISEYIDFFDATSKLEIDKVQEWQKITTTDEWKEIEFNIQNTDWNQVEVNNPKLSKDFWNYIDNPSIFLNFSTEDLSRYIPADTAKKCLVYFATDKERDDFLFYTQKPRILDKPIIKHNGLYYLFFQKQLSNSIYWFLFDVCKSLDEKGERIHMRREKRLEKKVQKLFNNFFDNKARIFTNYIFEDEEKDLLVLFKNLALIIEIKANKKNEPFRDANKAFTRIRRDFKECIQKGYDQTCPIRDRFKSNVEFEISIEYEDFKINPRRYKNVFSIVVTQERFGQIQTDLGLLLNIRDKDFYPWSVSVDDLEVFLLTLQRKSSKIAELISFLTHRELLHERLVCADELELCGYFLMAKTDFIKYCNSEEIFMSAPDVSNLFDDLHFVGLGFENERHIEIKDKRYDLIGYHLQHALGLKRIKKASNRHYYP